MAYWRVPRLAASSAACASCNGAGLGVEAEAAEEQHRDRFFLDAELLAPALAVDWLAREPARMGAEGKDRHHRPREAAGSDPIAQLLLRLIEHAAERVTHGLRGADERVPRLDRRSRESGDAVEHLARGDRMRYATEGVGLAADKVAQPRFPRELGMRQVQERLRPQRRHVFACDALGGQPATATGDDAGEFLEAVRRLGERVNVRPGCLLKEGCKEAFACRMAAFQILPRRSVGVGVIVQNWIWNAGHGSLCRIARDKSATSTARAKRAWPDPGSVSPGTKARFARRSGRRLRPAFREQA